MKTVYLTEKIHDQAIAYLRENFEVVCGYLLDNDEERDQAFCRSSGVLIRSAKIDRERMLQAPDLEVVAKHGIGVDNIDVNAATELRIQVVNAPFSNINAVAEHTVGLLFAAAKHIPFLDQRTRIGGFAERNTYLNTELSGKTFGLIGFGKIAQLVAKKLGALDMEILTNDVVRDEQALQELQVNFVSREELLRRSDFVSLHVPLIPQTEKMVNQDFLRAMKPGAILINASRGGVVDEVALLEALEQNVIGGAALDVFDPEPPRAGHPLFALPQVVVSPHNAALTDRAMLSMAMDGARGITECLLGQKITYPVNRIVRSNETNR